MSAWRKTAKGGRETQANCATGGDTGFKTAAFLIDTLLPIAMGKLAAIAESDPAAIDMPEDG